MDAIVLRGRLVRLESHDPAESQSRRDSRSNCLCCVWLRASWSVGTFELIDQSACLMEPFFHPFPCAPPSCSLQAVPPLPSLHRLAQGAHCCVWTRVSRLRGTSFPSVRSHPDTVLLSSSCLPAKSDAAGLMECPLRPVSWPSRCYHCGIGALVFEEHGWSDRALRGHFLAADLCFGDDPHLVGLLVCLLNHLKQSVADGLAWGNLPVHCECGELNGRQDVQQPSRGRCTPGLRAFRRQCLSSSVPRVCRTHPLHGAAKSKPFNSCRSEVRCVSVCTLQQMPCTLRRMRCVFCTPVFPNRPTGGIDAVVKLRSARCSGHTCLALPERRNGLFRWRLTRAAVSNRHQSLLAARIRWPAESAVWYQPPEVTGCHREYPRRGFPRSQHSGTRPPYPGLLCRRRGHPCRHAHHKRCPDSAC